MLCRCGHPSEVMETRAMVISGQPSARRRRECAACHRRWTTVEICYEGRTPAAVLSSTQVVALRRTLDDLQSLIDAMAPTIGEILTPDETTAEVQLVA